MPNESTKLAKNYIDRTIVQLERLSFAPTMLTTSEILRALKSNHHTKLTILGVFASDRLPEKVPRPFCLVVNTDSSDKPGAHWVAIFAGLEGTLDYFDSYGMRPLVPSIDEWISKVGGETNVNRRTLQGLMSATCGHHCIYFLIMRCKGIPMNQVVDMLSDSPFVNDSFVAAYINKNCNLKFHLFDGDEYVQQFCNVFCVN